MICPLVAALPGCHGHRPITDARADGRHAVLGSLRSIGNAAVSLARQVGYALDRVAPGRLIRNMGNLAAALLAVSGGGLVGARPHAPIAGVSTPDAVHVYADGERLVLEECISSLGASARPAENIAAHCLGLSAGNACRGALDASCRTVLYRSVALAIPDLLEPASVGKQAPDFEQAFQALKREMRAADYYQGAMVALEQAVAAAMGHGLASPSAAYTAAGLRDILEAEGSVEDPLQVVGVQGKRLYAGIVRAADRMYALDPDLMDRAGRTVFQAYLDKHFPDLPRVGTPSTDLGDQQVTTVLRELAKFLNRKYPATPPS